MVSIFIKYSEVTFVFKMIALFINKKSIRIKKNRVHHWVSLTLKVCCKLIVKKGSRNDFISLKSFIFLWYKIQKPI